MNRLVVIKASWGFGSHVRETAGPEARSRGVVIGFDGRHSSRRFAEDAAAVFAGLGVKALVFTDPVPTPLLAFSVKQLGAVGGVMVTASHNPPHDNGYKAYLPTGGQIIPPVDTKVAGKIKLAPRADRSSGLRRRTQLRKACGCWSTPPTAPSSRRTSTAWPTRRSTAARADRCGSPTRRCTASATG